MGLRNVRVDLNVCVSNYQFHVTESTPFRNLYIMYFILKTKHTLSLKFVPAQVRGNNH